MIVGEGEGMVEVEEVVGGINGDEKIQINN